MPTPRARLLFDAFHHMLPGHRIGKHIATGGYAVNFGRYAPGDVYHPNGLAHLVAALSPTIDLRLLNEPYSDLSLYDADILLITNPDYPLYEGATPYRWTPEGVDALMAFLERGGGCLLCVNSFLSRPDFWEENFDLERVSLLFDRLGVKSDPNYMSDDMQIEKAQSGSFRIGYGQGGRVLNAELPPGAEPLITYGDNIYGFRMKVGRGQLAVIGDTGMISNGLVSFPEFDNLAFLQQLFGELRPAWVDGGPTQWDCIASRNVSAAPSERGFNETMLRNLRPEADWVVDHHYRHLVWDLPGESGGGAEVWEQCPVALDKIGDAGSIDARLAWVALDADEPGSPFDMELSVSRSQTRDVTDLHLLGRIMADNIAWEDVAVEPESLSGVGKAERASAVFELRAVLDAEGRPIRARWAQGQRLFARSERAAHYGYEIILASASGGIVPRAL